MYQETQINIDPQYGLDPDYLIPQKDSVKDIKHLDNYIYNLPKKQKEKMARRKVYENVEYTQFEKQGIQGIKQEFEKYNQNPKHTQKIELPSDWKESDWLKMCYTQRFDFKKCLEKMIDHTQWRNDKSNKIVTAEVKQQLEKGFIYQLGRDKGQRPVLYIDVTKINIKDGKEKLVKTISVFLSMIKKKMFVPYSVENWVVVLDIKGTGIGDIPIKALGAIIGTMSTNFCATLERMFILNPSGGLKFMWGAVEAFMDQETADKIKMIKSKKDMDLVYEQIPNKKYIQKCYGGDLEDLTAFWPPRDIFTNIDQLRRDIQAKKEQEEKKKKEEQERLEKEKQENEKQLQQQQQQTIINKDDDDHEQRHKEHDHPEEEQDRQSHHSDHEHRHKEYDHHDHHDDNSNNGINYEENDKKQLDHDHHHHHPNENDISNNSGHYNEDKHADYSPEKNRTADKQQTVSYTRETEHNPGIKITFVEDQPNPFTSQDEEQKESKQQNQQQKQQEEEQEEIVVQTSQQQNQQKALKSGVNDQEQQQQQQQDNEEQQDKTGDEQYQQNIQHIQEIQIDGPESGKNCQCQCAIF